MKFVSRNHVFGELLAASLGAEFRFELRDLAWIDHALPPEVVLFDGYLDPEDDLVRRAFMRCRAQRLVVVAICVSRDNLNAARWVDLGADAIAYVDATAREVLDLVMRVCRGEVVLGIGVRETLLSELRAERAANQKRTGVFDSLTKREMEVLRLLAQAIGPEELARLSFVSVNTVRTQIRNILAKLSTTSVVGAVALAYSSGWMQVGDREALEPTKVECTTSN